MASKRSAGGGEGAVRLVAFVALASGAGGALAAWAQQRRERRTRDQQPPRAAGRPQPTGIKAKLRRLGERWRPFGVALDVQERFGELNGNSLAAAVTLQAFLALFPLLLVGVAIVGFFSANSQTDLGASIIGELGLTGEAAELLTEALETAEQSRRAASVVGLLGLAWSGLGLVGALQYGYDQVWQVDERGLVGKLVAVLWFVGFLVVAVASGVLTSVLRFLPGFLAPLGVLLGLGVNFVLFLWTMKILPNRDVGWRPLLPGAIAAAIGFEVLKAVASYVVPRQVASASELYGSLGVVFAVLAFLLLLGRLLIYTATLNVVLYERAHGTRTIAIEVPATPEADDEEQATRAGQAATRGDPVGATAGAAS